MVPGHEGGGLRPVRASWAVGVAWPEAWNDFAKAEGDRVFELGVGA